MIGIDKKVSRGQFLRWLRKTHGMLGLWGAVLGLLFGASGILLNHRNLMKLPLVQYEKSNVELRMPDSTFDSPEEVALWLKNELHLGKPASKIEAEKAKTVLWNNLTVQQPGIWKIDFHTPAYSVTTEYIEGNRFVSVKRQDANVYALISRLHKGIGANTVWILLADSLAGALIVLSITGVLLWTKMRGSRLTMAGLIGVCTLLTVGTAISML